MEAGEASPLVSPSEVPFPPSAAEAQLLRHQNHSSLSIVSDDSQTVAHGKPNPHLSVEEVSGRQFFYSFPNTPSTRTTPLPQASGSGSGSGTPTEYDDNDTASLASNPDPNPDADDTDELPVGRRKRTEPSTSAFQARLRRGRHRAHRLWAGFRDFMTVPLWAAIASLVVACIRPLQHALEEHLPPVKNAIASAGDCSIPVTLVVLGAYFYSPPDTVDTTGTGTTAAIGTIGTVRRGRAREERLPEHSLSRQSVARSASRVSLFESVRDMFSMKHMGGGGKGKSSDRSLGGAAAKEARPGETRTVVVAILSRMIITPLVLLPLMVLSTKYDLQKVFDECVFFLFLLISPSPSFPIFPIPSHPIPSSYPILSYSGPRMLTDVVDTARCSWCRTCC